MIGIINCTLGRLPVLVPHPIPFPFFVHGMAVLFLSGQHGTETSLFFGCCYTCVGATIDTLAATVCIAMAGVD